MEDKKFLKRNLIMFPLGTVGRDMVYNLVTSFLLTFVLFTLPSMEIASLSYTGSVLPSATNAATTVLALPPIMMYFPPVIGVHASTD